jgi:N-acetylglucosamine-6-phosphate deacetylase
VEGILATLITDDVEAMISKLRRLVHAREQSPVVAEMIVGFHLEGPFLNAAPGFIGAHPPSSARPADLDAMQRLLEAANGLTRIVTLAPECDPRGRVTEWLSTSGIVVAAGHCNPTLDELRGAIDAGVTMFTHLGNGCPLQLPRHDNIIQRALYFADQLWIGFIADGVHVPFFALHNYLKCAGFDRSFVVTDAISAAGLGPGTYRLGRETVVVDEQLATWSADRSHLMGSASTMSRLVTNLRRQLNLSAEAIDQLVRQNPRRAIGEERDDSA